jgi:hypothetical protein
LSAEKTNAGLLAGVPTTETTLLSFYFLAGWAAGAAGAAGAGAASAGFCSVAGAGAGAGAGAAASCFFPHATTPSARIMAARRDFCIILFPSTKN